MSQSWVLDAKIAVFSYLKKRQDDDIISVVCWMVDELELLSYTR